MSDVLENGGYVRLVESWGSDARIIEAARMSTSGAFKGWGTRDDPGDERLLGYLYRNQHATPFEMAGLVIEVQAPIFVVRQWMRHRTQSYNELSARYTAVPDLDYLPDLDRCVGRETANKQAGSIAPADRDAIAAWRDSLADLQYQAEQVYRAGLAAGVPKEIARLATTVARYTRFRASANLRNWLGFLRLRLDPHAQEETREYAEAVECLIADCFPRTYSLFREEMDRRG